MKLKVETSDIEIDKQLLDLITIDVLNIEQQNTSSQEIIALPMNPIINSYFNKHPMSSEIIHNRLIQTSNSVMREMCSHQNLNGPAKHCHKKLNQSPCTICYI